MQSSCLEVVHSCHMAQLLKGHQRDRRVGANAKPLTMESFEKRSGPFRANHLADTVDHSTVKGAPTSRWIYWLRHHTALDKINWTRDASSDDPSCHAAAEVAQIALSHVAVL